MKSDFKEILKVEAEKRNILLTDTMLQQLERYKNSMLAYNEKVNLTAITEEYEIVMKHFIDSLECVKYIMPGESIIDVGTGAGFPGIVIAIYFAGNVHITLLDALQKRLVFLQQVIEELSLQHVTIVHGRAEEVAHQVEHREHYDIVVSRALASLNILLEYDIAFAKKTGKCLLLKGDKLEQELKEANHALTILHAKVENTYKYEYHVNEELCHRYILCVRRIGEIKDIYPRNYGKIKKQPL